MNLIKKLAIPVAIASSTNLLSQEVKFSIGPNYSFVKYADNPHSLGLKGATHIDFYKLDGQMGFSAYTPILGSTKLFSSDKESLIEEEFTPKEAFEEFEGEIPSKHLDGISYNSLTFNAPQIKYLGKISLDYVRPINRDLNIIVEFGLCMNLERNPQFRTLEKTTQYYDGKYLHNKSTTITKPKQLTQPAWQFKPALGVGFMLEYDWGETKFGVGLSRDNWSRYNSSIGLTTTIKRDLDFKKHSKRKIHKYKPGKR